MLNGLDLFSGIGGISLALRDWVRTIAYCEADRYCQSVLLGHMASLRLDPAPVWDDVRSLSKEHLRDVPVDIITGGFPCQDISVAGNGEGLEGERSGLFYEIARLTKDMGPRFVFLENVPAVTTRGGTEVINTLTALGYDCRWTMVSAAELGAPHLRNRWFLLAHANSKRGGQEQISECRSSDQTKPRDDGPGKYVAHTGSAGLEGWEEPEPAWEALRQCLGEGPQGWVQGVPQPAVCRGPNGLPHRVDRIKGLGNAVVPLQAREAFRRLIYA